MKLISQISELRLLVSFLGEQSQYGWWKTNLISSLGLRFMRTNFPRTNKTAALQAVGLAATKDHDQKIGMGCVYHLFRLPYEMDQALHLTSISAEEEISFPENKEEALNRMAIVADEVLNVSPGPCQIGTKKTIRSAFGVQEIAKHYRSAFLSNIQCYPYFADE
jgi:hypothetical protein